MPKRPVGIALALTLVAVALPSAPLSAQTREEFDQARLRMVSEYIEREGIHNRRVLEAMRRVPRHWFVPPDYRSRAYWDSAWPIGYKQTITWPSVVAYMTETLDPQPNDRVLEVGTGSGYQAAVLSLLVKEVYSVEIVVPLGKAAEKRLKRLGYHNVKTKIGDGYAGWSEHAPFDKIIITCSPEKLPKPVIDQLKEGGRIVVPVGSRYDQEMWLFEKKHGELVRKRLMPTYFVPMTGRSDKDRTLKPDRLHPQIRNGGFEQREEDGQPTDWYNSRQLTIVDSDAPQGKFCARFDNEEPGRRAQMLQAVGVDGRRIATLRFTFKIRTDHVFDGPESSNQAGLQVSFDDPGRIVGEEIGAHWIGTLPWQTVTTTVTVPEDAHQAVIRIGLNGATGHLFIDDIKLTAERR